MQKLWPNTNNSGDISTVGNTNNSGDISSAVNMTDTNNRNKEIVKWH